MTISEIAKKANVSPATVDRVLHNRGRVSAATIKLVQDIIREDGFEPNQYARNLRLNKQYKFGVLIREFQSGDNSYWEILHDGCVAASKDMKSLSAQLIFGYFNDSPETSLYHVGKQLLDQDIDGLVLAPNSSEEVELLLAEINELPYAFVNMSYPGAAPLIDTSQNCSMAGKTAAKIMMMLKPDGKNFAAIGYKGKQNSSEQRMASYSSYFSERKNITVSNCLLDHTNNIKEQLQNFLTTHPKLNGIFITNTYTYLYMEEIRQVYAKARPAIIGYDAIPKNIELLESDMIDCLISQQPFSQGYNAVQQLYLHQILKNRECIEKCAPVTILFKENLGSYKATIRERFY